MNNTPNPIIAELLKIGMTQEEAEQALAESRAKPGSTSSLAKAVIEAWNSGESSVPIFIAVQLAMAVLGQRSRDTNTAQEER